MVIDFNSFYDLPRELNRIFDEAMLPLKFSQRRISYPLVNLCEDDANYYVDINVPGVEKDSIDLTLTDKSLVIKGERKVEEGKYFRQERLAGNFQRIIAIPDPVDRDKIEAKYKNGVLEVVLPKSESVKPMKISIES